MSNTTAKHCPVIVSFTTCGVTVGELDSVDVCWHRHVILIVSFLPPSSGFLSDGSRRISYLTSQTTGDHYRSNSQVNDICNVPSQLVIRESGWSKLIPNIIHSTGICYFGQSPDLFTVRLLFLTCPGFMPCGGRSGLHHKEGPLKVCPFLQIFYHLLLQLGSCDSLALSLFPRVSIFRTTDSCLLFF